MGSTWRTGALASAVVALALVAAPVAGQGIGVAAGAGLYSFGGSDYDGVDRTPALDGRVFYQAANGLQLGVGYATMTLGEADGDVNRTEIFAEPRWGIFLGEGRFVPYIGARGSYVRENHPGDFDVNGFDIGGTVGVYVRMGETTALDLSGLTSRFTLDRVSGADAPAGLESLSGTRFGLRIGIVFTLATF